MDRYFLFSLIKKMRIPIITIIIYYAISITGLLLISGVDDQGNSYNMSLFHSLYIVVYTSTTIGFGEIPFPWTENQRLWIIIISVFGVVSWVYSMGSLISLSQNKIFKEQIEEYRFENMVLKNKNPFYIMCGFGVTGKEVLHLMHNHNINIVLIDKEYKTVSHKDDIDYKKQIPYLKGDCSNIYNLKKSGLLMPNCVGIIIVTGDEDANVRTAISCKLLSPDKKILVRAFNKDNIRNLSSFGTDHIISESSLFAKEISLLINNIYEHNLRKKLNGEIKKYSYNSKIPSGKWIICGLNTTTSKVATQLINNNIDFVILTNQESKNKLIKGYCINIEGINSEDLLCAGIKDASVIFSASNNDFKNLSTLITAKELNPDIYTIVIQNKSFRDELFNKIKIDFIMQPQYRIAAKIHSLISEPYLNDYLNIISEKDIETVKRIESNLSGKSIKTWHFRMNNEKCFYNELVNLKIKIDDIIPFEHSIVPLMVVTDNHKIIEPSKEYILKENDVVLFTGENESFCRQRFLMYNKNVYEDYQKRKHKKVN